MRHFLIFLAATLCWLAPSRISADNTDAERLKNYARHLALYDNFYTQEKVYLHLDNNGYLPGETIWFKAYVFKASSLLPTNLSKVLYVELLSPRGQILQRKTLPIYNGRTYGDFKLDPMLSSSGYYEIRAYTRAMLNWDDAYIFSRVLPVYEEPKDTTDFADLRVEEGSYYTKTKKPSLLRSAPEPLISEQTIKEGKTLLTFYPEGGNITQGLPAKVAFKITDNKGIAVNEQLNICDNNGNIITTSAVFHDGMGIFELPANWTGGFATLQNDGGKKFALPAARARGCDIHASHNADSTISVNILSSPEYRGKDLGLTVTCRAKLCDFIEINVSGNDTVSIPLDKQKEGIMQITLFTPEGEILSERLVWSSVRSSTPSMIIRQNEDSYKPFSPVVLDINLKDAEGNPLQADFSLSVRDADTENTPDYHSLQVDMLLASELKGYIRNPEFYFRNDNPKSNRALDLLLMVQGWKRYSWREMAGIDTFKLKQPVEEGLLLNGHLRDTHATRNTLKKDKGVNVNILANTPKGVKLYDTKTDENGNFAFLIPRFYGDYTASISATNMKDRRIYTDIALDRNFSPLPKIYEPAEVTPTVSTDLIRTNNLAKSTPKFDWVDTIPDLISKVINLKQVEIKHKKVTYGFNPAKLRQWDKGENAVKRESALYYDIIEELDKYLDRGDAIPNIFEWLVSVNPQFEYEPELVRPNESAGGKVSESAGEGDHFEEVPHLTFRGREVAIVVDNDKQANGRLPKKHSWMMHEFRSMAIVENIERANNITRFTVGGEAEKEYNSSNIASVVYLFTRDKVPEYYIRGTRRAILHGYSLCDDFYSPDYRLSEPPTASDHRRTLFWNPSLTTDKDGKTNVIFYSNSRENQRLHINAQGIAINGQAIEYKP